MEMLEEISTAFAQDIEENCPFQEDASPSSSLSEEEENIEDDDEETLPVIEMQANNGGVLGENLTAASPGKSGTVGGPYPSSEMKSEPQRDTARTLNQAHVHVPASPTEKVEEASLPYTVAAHHLIPGNAALKTSSLYEFLKKDGKVKSQAGNEWKISAFAGYNVNGCHNGVWLPGSYAIRAGTSVMKDTWSVLRGRVPVWCMNYAAAVTKVADGQFHDTHVTYSEKVQERLDDLATLLFKHLDVCKACKGKKELPPPYRVKASLYAISETLKGKVKARPEAWKGPWFTSDKLKEIIMKGGKLDQDFKSAYEAARIAPPKRSAS